MVGVVALFGAVVLRIAGQCAREIRGGFFHSLRSFS